MRVNKMEKIKLLRQGAGIWNQWRQSHPETEIDFSRVDLSNINLNEQ